MSDLRFYERGQLTKLRREGKDLVDKGNARAELGGLTEEQCHALREAAVELHLDRLPPGFTLIKLGHSYAFH